MDRLPGFRDFYPEPLPHASAWSSGARQYIFETWRQAARRYGFTEYDGPPIEPLELYTLKSGEEIVGQLYNFVDKGGRAVALRPEMTPTLARMVAAHERNYRKPLKWFAIPQLFRYERQQKGRLREHFQFNADIVGEPDPAADAELIALLIDTLRSFGLAQADFVLRLSSRNAWQKFYADRCSNPENAGAFYQVIDKLERDPPAESESKLHALGFRLEDVQEFIARAEPSADLQVVADNLRARGLSEFFRIDYNVIRGLAYYTGVVFEAFDRKGEFRAIAGGGRYDNLVQLISGGKVNLPALGFGMGDVVLLELLSERKLLPPFKSSIDVFVLIEDETLREGSLRLVQELRSFLSVEYPLVPAKPDKQLKRALECNARFSAKLVADEQGGHAIQLRNLATREETRVSQAADLNRTPFVMGGS
ncbi:MAG: histidine--tRNA ligase [Verrucomicrobiia bacterium]